MPPLTSRGDHPPRWPPRILDSGYRHLWVVPSHVVLGFVCVTNRMQWNDGLQLRGWATKDIVTSILLSWVTPPGESQLLCGVGAQAACGQGQCSEELRPPANSQHRLSTHLRESPPTGSLSSSRTFSGCSSGPHLLCNRRRNCEQKTPS